MYKNALCFGFITCLLGILVGIICTSLIMHYTFYTREIVYKDKIRSICTTYGRYHWVCAEYYVGKK